MPSFDNMLGILAVGGIAWIWYRGLTLRERALAAIDRICAELRVQALDQTVALRRIGLGRDAYGRLSLRRTYGFEFSVRGADRCPGSLTFLGDLLESIRFEHPDGPIVIAHP